MPTVAVELFGVGIASRHHRRALGDNALVCVASALLMIVTVYQNQWMRVMPTDTIL